MSVVLMYHALFPDNDTSAIDAEDLPYAVSVSDFTRQLDLLAERRVGLFNVEEGDGRRLPEVVITFDDGHASNLHLAAPLLKERNLAAYFFVTSEFIGQRSGFMSRDELRELSHIPGMCIGSHGATHRFFDDLNAEQSMDELTQSRQMLEEVCDSACVSISFPGGRYNLQTLGQLAGAGYTQWFGSDIGLVSAEQLAGSGSNEGRLQDRWALVAQTGQTPLARVAIKRNSQLDEFHRIIAQQTGYFRRKRLNNKLKLVARKIIGNRLYHGLYKSISAR